MIDERFYFLQPKPSLSELAAAGKAEIHTQVSSAVSVNSFENANDGDLTFIEKFKGVELTNVRASVCITSREVAELLPKNISIIVSDKPRWSYGQAAKLIAVPRHFHSNMKSISDSSTIEKGVIIGPNVIIGDDVCIGADTIIGPGTVIWPGVKIGKNCSIGSNVTIKTSLIGNNVTLSSGVVLGETGFGLSIGPNGADDSPHFGRVIVQDWVSIGSNSCVDCGVFGDTIIGERVKIDNLCHISHNVVIEAHSVLAAFCGVAGSTVIGSGTQMGGACSVADHLTVGRQVKLAGNSGLMSDIPDGETWGGYPAKPIKSWFRETVWLSKQVVAQKNKK